MIFPWQEQQWQQLMSARQEKRLPHALLFTGIAGTGKTLFSEYFARALLCKQPSFSSACECHSCRLFEGRVHPNILWVEPEKEGQAIKVDVIREVCDFINQSSLQGEYRLVLINPADRMNVNAANALLKTLEEPSANAIIILISNQPSRMPATILSRCQRILFPQPEKQSALQWLNSHLTDKTLNADLLLKLANGAPLAALKLIEEDIFTLRADLFTALYALTQKEADPLKLAAKIQDNDLLYSLDLMLNWIMDVIRLQLNLHDDQLINTDYVSQLSELKDLTQLKSNHAFLAYLQQLRAQVCIGLNLNKQLLLENIFIRWMECAA